jgi:16S rRNA processing protein RimM
VTTPAPANVTVARIVRAHGHRGEVAAEILTDFPERLKGLDHVQLWDGISAPRTRKVASCWLSHSRGGQAIFHFEGCDSIPEAKKLVGLEVQVPFSERMKLPDRSYYISDLVGCEVRGPDGAAIGLVSDVRFTGEDVAGTPILLVASARGEVQIPLAQDICVNVDVATRRIDVNPPEGLLELNA